MPTEPNREETIFAAALKLPTGERAAFLDRECAGDAQLHQRVEALLLADAQAGEFLEGPAPGVSAETVVVTTGVLPAAEKTGERIGRYKLLDKIGEGGFGDVWMAEQEEPVRRRVAFKIIKAGMDTREVVARFEAERQALALMDHPNIAHVFDGGATVTGRPYFVMELVRGVPIAKYCDEHRLSVDERLELFIQVCQAVQHAHQKGIIHRDLKPSNVLVALLEDRAVPKVIDFGIAKATAQRLTEKTLFTRFQQFVGTPAYMSPEQTGTNREDIDTRSDIYSLGVLLYELLTGRTPFETQKLLAAGYETILRTIREQEPPKPSTRLTTLSREELSVVAAGRRAAPEKLGKTVRGDLDWIVMKCLEKDRTRRYETATGLAADIARHLNNEPILAAPPSAAYRLRRFARRHRVALATTVAFGLVLEGGIVTSTWQFWRANRFGREAERQRQVATNEAARANRLLGESEQARQETERKRQALEASLYASRVSLAYQAWENGDVEEAEGLLALCPSALRGWEWHYLRRQCHQEILSFDAVGSHRERLRSHLDSFNIDTLGGQLVFSREGSRLYATGQQWGAAAFETTNGMRLMTVTTNATSPDRAFFSQDGSLFGWLPTGNEAGVLLDLATDDRRKLQLPFESARQHCLVAPSWRWAAFRRSNGVVVVSIPEMAEVGSFPCAPNSAQVHALSADGAWLVASSADGRGVTVWNVRTRKATLTIVEVNMPNSEPPQAIEFSRDNRRLAIVGKSSGPEPDRTILGVWDLERSRRLFVRTIPPWSTVCFAADNKYLIVSSLFLSPDGNDTLFLDAETGSDVLVLRADNASAHGERHWRFGFPTGDSGEGMIYGTRAIASPDGRSVALAVMDRTVQVIDTAAPFHRRVFRGHRSPAISIAFSPDGKRLASLDRRGFIKQWDLSRSDGLELATAWPDALSVSRDGRLVVWKDKEDDAQCSVLDPITLARGKGSFGLSSTDDFRDLVAMNRDQLVTAAGLWDVRLSERVLRFEESGINCGHLAACSNGRFVANARFTKGLGNWVGIWSTETGSRVGKVQASCPVSFGPFAHHDGSICMAFSPNGQFFAVATDRNDEIEIYRTMAKGDEPTELCRFRGRKSVLFGPDNNWLLCECPEGGFQRVDAASGKVLRKYSVRKRLLPDQDALAWELSPDGRLAVCYTAGLPVINLDTGETLYETGALPWRVWASFSPDGRRLAIPGGDQIVRVWSPETRSEVTRMPVRGSLVRFTADGTRLVVISPDGGLSVLNGSPNQESER